MSESPAVEEDSDIHAAYAGAKRRIAALEQQLQSMNSMAAKRKS